METQKCYFSSFWQCLKMKSQPNPRNYFLKENRIPENVRSVSPKPESQNGYFRRISETTF